MRTLIVRTLLVLAWISMAGIISLLASSDTGYNNSYRVTVRTGKQTFVCDDVAIWESRLEIEVAGCQ